MTFEALNNDEIEVGKPLVKNIFRKTKENFDTLHRDLNNLAIGTQRVEIFNASVSSANFYETLTGLAYHQASFNFTLTACIVSIFDKGGVETGNLEVDIKKNNSHNPDGMETVFSTKPSIDMATINDYGKSSDSGQTSAVFDSASVSENDVLRLDITSIPAGLDRFNILLIGGIV